MDTAPRLETARLVLRAHVSEDLEDCAAMWAHPDVVRHISGKPSTREETWSRVLRYIGHWAAMGFGYWALMDKASNRFVGEVGFADFKREMTPSISGTPEGGWVLAPWAFGNGFATEAVGAAVAWQEATFGSKHTVCIINPDNFASIRVAEKCGYKERVRATYKGQPTILFDRISARTA